MRTELEARRRGDAAWTPLPSTRTSTGFSSRLDDEILPNGEVRASCTGNGQRRKRTVNAIVRGRVSSRVERCRLRVDTRLVAGQIKIVKGRRTRGGRRRTRRVIVVRPKIRFGRHDPDSRTAHDAGRQCSRRRRHRGLGGQWNSGRSVSTRGGDRYRRLRALHVQRHSGPSRTLRFRYPGTPLVRARTTEVDLRVKATSTIGVNRRRVVNGEDIVSPWPDSRRAVADGWQAGPAAGILAWQMADVCHATRRREDGSLVVSLPVHVDARHGSLSVPSADSAGGRVPVHRRPFASRRECWSRVCDGRDDAMRRELVTIA